MKSLQNIKHNNTIKTKNYLNKIKTRETCNNNRRNGGLTFTLFIHDDLFVFAYLCYINNTKYDLSIFIFKYARSIPKGSKV